MATLKLRHSSSFPLPLTAGLGCQDPNRDLRERSGEGRSDLERSNTGKRGAGG